MEVVVKNLRVKREMYYLLKIYHQQIKFRIPTNSFWKIAYFLTKIHVNLFICSKKFTAWKVSKYGVVSGTYFLVFLLNTERYYLSVFSPNTGKYGPEISPYLETFHAVISVIVLQNMIRIYVFTKFGKVLNWFSTPVQWW